MSIGQTIFWKFVEKWYNLVNYLHLWVVIGVKNMYTS